MNYDEAVLRVLTEIRDQQREEIVYRRKVLEDSLQMQRIGLRRQLFAMILAPILVVAGLLLFFYGVGVLRW